MCRKRFDRKELTNYPMGGRLCPECLEKYKKNHLVGSEFDGSGKERKYLK
jgi:hypothetical protein